MLWTSLFDQKQANLGQTPSLIRWGTYRHWICTEAGDYRLCIQRLRCQGWGRAHSLLPDILQPDRHYVLRLLYQVARLFWSPARNHDPTQPFQVTL